MSKKFIFYDHSNVDITKRKKNQPSFSDNTLSQFRDTFDAFIILTEILYKYISFCERFSNENFNKFTVRNVIFSIWNIK